MVFQDRRPREPRTMVFQDRRAFYHSTMNFQDRRVSLSTLAPGQRLRGQHHFA